MFKPIVEVGEVLVYVDFCEECFCNHRIEHHADGTTRHDCKVWNDPAYYNAGHRAGVFTFRVRHSAPLAVQLPAAPIVPAWFEQYADLADAQAMAEEGHNA